MQHGTPIIDIRDGSFTQTSTEYCSVYLHGGTDELLENRYKGYWGLLDSRQFPALRKEPREHIYMDAKSVAEWIKSTFGVEYSHQGVVDFYADGMHPTHNCRS